MSSIYQQALVLLSDAQCQMRQELDDDTRTDMQQIHVPVSGRVALSQTKLLCILALVLGIAILACQEATAASVSPTSLTFQAVQGATSLSSQTISVNKETMGPGTWTATESAA